MTLESDTSSKRPRAGTAVAVGGVAGLGVAIGLVALNLRPAVTSVGALLGQIQSAIGMSAGFASLVVATPVACFGIGGHLAWTVRRWWGTRRAVLVALGVVAVSLVCRVTAGPHLLWLGTITACAGIAVLATLLPEIIQAAPELQRRRLSTWWASAFGLGPALGALVTPRLAEATTWRTAAASWAALTMVALVAWPLATTRLFPGPDHGPERVHVHPWRLRPRWPVVALTVHFGLLVGASFTLMGWLEPLLETWAGMSRSDARWMFGICMTLGVFIAPVVPRVATHRALPNQSAVVGLLSGWTLAGTIGLWLWPDGPPWLGTWLWAGLIGIGTPSVVLAQFLIVLRTRDRDSTAALSTVVNSAGFGIAGVVALSIGWIYAATGNWAWPLATLAVVLAGQVITGVVAGRAVVIALPAGQTSQEIPHMNDSTHTAPSTGTTTGSSRRGNGDRAKRRETTPMSPGAIPRQQRSESPVRNGHSGQHPEAAVYEPLGMLHQRLLPLTVTPTHHDPIVTLIELTTALRVTTTDALTQHIPTEGWQIIGDTLRTAGTIYRDLARHLNDYSAGHQSAVELRCPLCECPFRDFTTFTEALRALEAHANTSHTTHRGAAPAHPATATPKHPATTQSSTVDARQEVDSVVVALATLEHQLKAAVHTLLIDQTPRGRAAVLMPIRHRVLRLESTLTEHAPQVLDLLHFTPGNDNNDDYHDQVVDGVLTADRQLYRALRTLGVSTHQPSIPPARRA